MVELNPILKKAYWSLAGLGGVYMLFLVALATPVVQKNFLYMHHIKLTFKNIEKPDLFGFAKNQITPFRLTTSDDETLFGWHVIPQGAYLEHKTKLVKEPTGIVYEADDNPSFDILKNDPEAKLIVFFHGNAGNVGMGWRPDAYRNFMTADAKHAHILAIDYRGFGQSTGTPTEDGLITDATSVLKFAINNLKIPSSRIVVVGHSLGSGVTVGATEKLAREEGIEFGGVILVASFPSLKKLVLTYSFSGILPILGPLQAYPILQNFFLKYIKESWDNGERLQSLARHSKNLKFAVIHAYLDPEIIYTSSSDMFTFAVNGIRQRKGGETVEKLTIDQVEKQQVQDMDEVGSYTNSWTDGVGSDEVVEQIIVNWGSHNKILTHTVVSMTIRRFLGL